MENFTQLLNKCATAQETAAQIDDVVRIQSRRNDASSTILKMAPIFSLIAFVACLILLAAVIYALFKRRIPSRKYSVVISRTSADVFSSALIAASSLLANNYSASYAVLALFLFVATFGVVQLALSHLLIFALRQISVTRPYGFQSMCSIRRLSLTLGVTWVASLLYAAAFAPLVAVILDPSTSVNICSYETCQKPLMIVGICIIGIAMLSVVLSYALVVLKLRHIAQTEKMHNEPEVTRKKLRKFVVYGGHVGLYCLITSLLFTAAIIVAHNLFVYNHVRGMLQYNCDYMHTLTEYIEVLVRLETLAGGAVLLWAVRIAFDVVVAFAADYGRLLPWLAADAGGPLLQASTASALPVRHGLAWQDGCVNCPVFSLDDRLHPLDFKN